MYLPTQNLWIEAVSTILSAPGKLPGHMAVRIRQSARLSKGCSRAAGNGRGILRRYIGSQGRERHQRAETDEAAESGGKKRPGYKLVVGSSWASPPRTEKSKVPLAGRSISRCSWSPTVECTKAARTCRTDFWSRLGRYERSTPLIQPLPSAPTHACSYWR